MRVFAPLLLAASFAIPAHAATDRDWTACSGQDPDKSIAACSRIISRGKDTKNNLAIAYYNRANQYIGKGEHDLAIVDYEKSLQLNPKDGDAHNGRGDAAWNKGEYKQALTHYSAAIALDPKKPSYYEDRGDAYTSLEEYENAIADFSKAIALGIATADIQVDRGHAYAQKRDLDNALADFQKAVEIDPQSVLGHSNQAWVYEQKGDLDTALAHYSEAVRLAPDDAGPLASRGWVYTRKKEFARAIADFDAALKLKPEDGGIWHSRGSTLREKGDLDLAIKDLTEAIRLLPTVPDPLIDRAATFDDMKDFDRAVQDYDAALALAPDNAGALNGRCWARAQKGDLERALPDCDRAVVLLPNDPNVMHSRAWTQTRRGALALAFADFDTALKADPEMPGIYADRGYAFELKGDRDRAIADYQKALALKSKQKYDDTAKAEALKRLTALATQPSTKIEPVREEDDKPALPAEPDKRIALVIGNAEYKNTAPLKNPANDSRAVAASLRRLGFDEVIEKHDLTLAEFSEALKSFGDRANGMDWAVIYYAGHGIEIGGTNYVIPVDASLKSVTHVDDEAIPLQRVLSKVEGAHKMRLVILDACRDNPFAGKMAQGGATRSVGRGLARVEPVPGVLVAYAARDGQVAQDGDAANSPYAAALVEQLEKPGVEIDLMFRRVGARVRKATNDQQIPFTYGSLPEDALYFNPK